VRSLAESLTYKCDKVDALHYVWIEMRTFQDACDPRNQNTIT